MIEDKLDLTYYSGKDLYSDGDVEDELLKCVGAPKDIENELLTGSSWPHLYHLSNIRENVLDWYDFKKDASLLEIGSGCGALTGLFCRKVDHVVAIDLSKKRSMINATRNEEHNNLKIMLGNFEDIELEEKFDYVTLIGVLEYSIYYINSDNPFMDMLNRAKSFLKPDGRLIIAIENKYGLKYFSGAGEDHSGRLFDGIENYAAVDRVRTFSKGTLLNMLGAAGFADTQVYYPMPDYKLPSQVFSSELEPGFGSIRDACCSYDRDRYELFDERLAYDSICEDGMFGEFANSFIMISSVGKTDFEGDKVLYAKYNRQRCPEFQISTIIKGRSDGTKYVEKKALRNEAARHICNLKNNYELLNKQYIDSGRSFARVLPVEITHDTARFEYVCGQSLEKIINKSLVKYHTNRQEILTAVRNALDRIYPLTLTKAFEITQDFEQMFGKIKDNPGYEQLSGLESYSASNIDCIFSNFVQTDSGELVCLDYEWVFTFPIPVDYLKYRTLSGYYGENRPYLQRYIERGDFLKEFGIDEKLSGIFAAMDDNYQQYVHGKDRRYIYTANYCKKVTNIGKNMQYGEPWFLSVMDDLNVLNDNLGPHRRDLVRCNIKMHRKSEFIDRWKRRLANPQASLHNFINKFKHKENV
jgi:SAM-dependent methyltransferase